ncbi:amino acid permease [Pseudofrancisella aestuarii]|uniref:Amino acid permease n=1 Tax=Pseudofrancisella aestuarii TaxID=2670347 RepID=A0ABV9TBQ6_9GAMM|nr:aromatic amino acid transport family protein [Pseudofrancisella aestuarii]
MILSRKFGAAMIISGTCIGAGMLAIPATVASCGFFIGSILIISIWLLMTFTALVLAEVNLKMKDGSNFVEMTRDTLGSTGVVVVWITYVLLLYSLVAAYTVGGGSLISTILAQVGINLSSNLTGIIFVFVFGAFVYISTRAVDHMNKLMLFLKLTAFFLLVLVLASHIKLDYLKYTIKNGNYIWATFPVLLTSFGFHHIVPTLRTYVNSDKKALRQAIILGSTIPLIVYLLWIFVTLGSLPVETPTGILGRKSGEITSVIINHYGGGSGLISILSFAFGFFALATSFLGVALGLFDFNRNTYGLESKQHKHKLIAIFITFLPAYIYAVLYPDGFIAALGYASIFVAILQVALPVIMFWVLKYRQEAIGFVMSLMTVMVVFIAIFIIVLQILVSIDLLPILKP